MPQIPVNSTNIGTFKFSASVDLYNRSILFDTSETTYNGSGIDNVAGIAFSLVDSQGLELMGVDWDNPQIVPSTDETYELDLTSSPINFLFQPYKIIGYIKDQDGTVYNTTEVLKKVCQPAGINESGYVAGDFEVIPDCINNTLTVKEFTVLTYDNKTASTVTKSGTLSYPTGTIAPVAFTGTPFYNNELYTGEYRIVNTTVATYDLGDDIFVLVTYLTNQPFPVTCSNFIGDITCCLTDVYNQYLKNCENSIGQAALQKYNSVLPSILNGLVKQINGQDASVEVALIKKQLNCNCGGSSLRQNEGSPTNPAIYSILLNGVGGTTVGSPTITGNTKTYNIASKTYVVAKGDTGDLAYTITQDTSVTNVVTYKITFNYDTMATYILNAITNDPTLLNQLNNLVTGTGGSIVGLDGKCVIDLSTSDYSVSQAVNNSTLITNIVINGTNYAAPGSLFANNASTVASWLNSLTLGTFSAVVAGGVLTIQSVGNANVISTITFTTPNIVKLFSATNATLVQVLQGIIDYICDITALQVKLGNNLALCTFDYNGAIVSTNYQSTNALSVFNAGVASAICNLANQIFTLTGITCVKLRALFVDNTSALFSGATARIFGMDQNGNCVAFTPEQIGLAIMNSINTYSNVKDIFCNIDCGVPGSCPDISNTNLAMSGANIGVYGLTWATSTLATQTVTVKYKLASSSTWLTATSSLLILPNGSISGTTPYLITGVTAGTTYDVWIQNNCGGAGFVKQITTPTGSVYPAAYFLDNIIYDICGAGTTTLYSSQPFGVGVFMFTDIGMTIPVTGYTFITIAGQNIFTISSGTGQVLSDTGSACSTGTAGSYQLGNSTATICASSPVTLYTSGAFAVGKILYTDAALTTPQTGFSYVVYASTIYNVNSITGAVTSTTGLNCINYYLNAALNMSINSVTGTGVPTLPATGTNGSQNGHHTAMSGNYNITITGTPVITTKVVALINSVPSACIAVPSAGVYVLAVTAAETDTVIFSINGGVC